MMHFFWAQNQRNLRERGDEMIHTRIYTVRNFAICFKEQHIKLPEQKNKCIHVTYFC